MEIIDLLGVKGGAVALTKIDRVESARVASARAEIEALLRGTALAGSPVFALSSMTGDGVPALRAHLEAMAASPPPAGAADGCFRLAVDRCFAFRQRHGGDRDGVFRKRGCGRPLAGVAVRLGSAGAQHPRAKPRGRARRGGPALRAQPRRC